MVFLKQPRVLLLDEPSAGLSPKLVHEVMAKVKELNKILGTTILLVEQNVREALTISGRALALVNGNIALETSDPRGWLDGDQLEQLFLGESGSWDKNGQTIS
jgi:branched-chain amino acid transport system ATP-binding protein